MAIIHIVVKACGYQEIHTEISLQDDLDMYGLVDHLIQPDKVVKRVVKQVARFIPVFQPAFLDVGTDMKFHVNAQEYVRICHPQVYRQEVELELHRHKHMGMYLDVEQTIKGRESTS